MRYLLNFSKRLITHLKHDEFIKLNIKEGQLFISNTRDGEEAYAFDTDGQLKSIKWFNPNSELIYFKGITYGSKGVTLEENYYQSLNGYQRILKSYDKHDNLVSEDLLVATNQSDWRLRKRTSFLTENNFLIKKEIDYNEDGNVKKFDERRLTKKIKKVTSENKCHLTLKKEETLKNGKTKCVVQNEHGKLEKILGARGELLKVTFYKVRSIIKNDFQALDVSYNKLFQFEYLYKANRLVVEIAIDFSNEKDLVFYKKKFQYSKNLVRKTHYLKSNNGKQWDLLWVKKSANKIYFTTKDTYQSYSNTIPSVSLFPEDEELLDRIKNIYQNEVNFTIDKKVIISEALRLLVLEHGKEIVNLHNKQLLPVAYNKCKTP